MSRDLSDDDLKAGNGPRGAPKARRTPRPTLVKKTAPAGPDKARKAELDWAAAHDISQIELDSPRWCLMNPEGKVFYADGGLVDRVPDPARLAFFHPTRLAWKANRDAYDGISYVDLTGAERARAAPGCDDVALAVGLWTEAFINRHTLPADQQAEHYRFEAEAAELDAQIATEDNDMAAAKGHKREVVEYLKLATEYGKQAEDDAAKAAEQLPYTRTSMRDLRKKVFDPLVFITQGEIKLTAGAYLLAGKPKHGKTWLAMGLAASACTGDAYLGTTPTKPGQVIYIACDDSSERRFCTRMDAITTADMDLTLITKWEPDVESTIDLLDAERAQHPDLRIVFIDTLSAFRKGQRTDSPYQQEYDEVKALNDWAHTHGVVVIIIHHLRKGAVAPQDPFESISGTLGLQGACDGMMVLAREDAGDGPSRRKLAGFWMRARDNDHETAIGMELKDGHWRSIGTIDDVFSADTQHLILQVLREAEGRWVTSKEIHAAGSFDCKLESVRRAATRMAAAGKIESHHGALDGKAGGGGFRLLARGAAS